MRKTIISLSLLLTCSIASADPKEPGTHDGYSTIDMLESSSVLPKLNMVSVEQLAKELQGKPPMAVGFDIDDTTLITDSSFYRGQQMFSPDGYSYLSNQQFWDKANCEWEVFSRPKDIAKKLIAMHLERGDDIYFITGRTGSSCEITTQYIKEKFNIKNMHKVIFAGSSRTEYLKAKHIKEHNIKIYYGDHNGDIISARKAGAEGIRVMRNSSSTYKPIPKNGLYGERVLENSQF